MMTAKDPETNILRTTLAGFAAIAGGADSLSILPHTITHGLPENFARRVARNTQLIMASESHIGFVADPASGSGGIETLTAALCEEAWQEFQRIEAEGGVLNSLVQGHIQQRVFAARDKRAEAFRSAKRALVGTTIYPLKTERPVETMKVEKRILPPVEAAASCQEMLPVRIDELLGAK
jgi:methylmalonyl-CoA mutase